MPTYRAYAAKSAKSPLEPYSYDPGELGSEEVEIKVSHCGICHSDLSMLGNDWGMSSYPFVPGHEVVGVVSALGDETKGLKIGQKVGLGWWAHSCLSCHECLSGDQHLCASAQGTIIGRHGGFADRVRAQWTWVRPLPEGVNLATTGPLLCAGVTVFAPLVIHGIRASSRVGVIGIGGLGHMALQFCNKWGCEVHAFTTSDSKEAEAKKLGAHYVYNTKKPDVLKKLSRSFDMILATIDADYDVPGFLETLKPKGKLHNVGAVLNPLQVPAFSLILGQRAVAGSPTGSPVSIDDMLEFSARHKVAPVIETFPMSQVNEALAHLRAGKARYRLVLINDME
jgi:alcohol/geraniol dehydrogenase (NADP+)